MQFQALRWNGSDPDRPLFPNRVRKADRLQTTRVGRWRSLARCPLAAIHSCSHFDPNGHPRPSRFDGGSRRSEEHTSELQSLMRISYAVFCLKKKNTCQTSSYITPQHCQLTHHFLLSYTTIH